MNVNDNRYCDTWHCRALYQVPGWQGRTTGAKEARCGLHCQCRCQWRKAHPTCQAPVVRTESLQSCRDHSQKHPGTACVPTVNHFQIWACWACNTPVSPTLGVASFPYIRNGHCMREMRSCDIYTAHWVYKTCNVPLRPVMAAFQKWFSLCALLKLECQHATQEVKVNSSKHLWETPMWGVM